MDKAHEAHDLVDRPRDTLTPMPANELEPFEMGKILGDINARLVAIEMKLNATLSTMTNDMRELQERVRVLEDDHLRTKTETETRARTQGAIAGLAANILWFVGQFAWENLLKK